MTAPRGRLHRPDRLELCTTCCWLRGPYVGWDNLCRCDSDAWDRDPIPRCGDLHDNAHLCRSCVAALAPGSSRWTSYYCAECRPHVFVLNRLAGRCVVPIGPHSMMNGVFHTPPEGPGDDASITSFSDQLTTLFRHQTDLHDFATRRVRTRLDELGVDTDAIAVDDYFARCRDAGWDAEHSFVELVTSLGEGFDEASARELWSLPPDTGRPEPDPDDVRP